MQCIQPQFGRAHFCTRGYLCLCQIIFRLVQQDIIQSIISKHPMGWRVSSTPFPFHFLVHLHFNLVSSLLAVFSTRIASQMIIQMIECYQFSCRFPVTPKRYGKRCLLFKTHHIKTFGNNCDMTRKQIVQKDSKC